MSPPRGEDGRDEVASRLLIGSPLRRPSVAVAVLVTLSLVLLVAVLVFLSSVAGVVSEGAGGVGLRALVLAVVLSLPAVGLLLFLDRREREPPLVLAAVFVWGMVVATGYALIFNSLGQLALMTGLSPVGGGDAAFLLTAWLVAPPVEETLKGAGILLVFWLLRTEFNSPRDGIVYGALVGLGFNALETALYVVNGYLETGTAPFGIQFAARFTLLGLGGHALFSGLFGAGLGAAMTERRGGKRLLWPFLGLCAAILAHAMSNSLGVLVTSVVASALGVSGAAADPAFLPVWVGSLAADVVILGGFFAALIALLIRSSAWERRVVAEELWPEIGHTITRAEHRLAVEESRFRSRRLPGLARVASRTSVDAQNRLAFRKRQVRLRGEDPERDELVWLLRSDVARLHARPPPPLPWQRPVGRGPGGPPRPMVPPTRGPRPRGTVPAPPVGAAPPGTVPARPRWPPPP